MKLTAVQKQEFASKVGYYVLTDIGRQVREHTDAGKRVDTKHSEELHRVSHVGEHTWSWAWVCVECVSVIHAPCPDRVEMNDAEYASPAAVQEWLRHLKEHGWLEEDFDPAWRQRTRGHERWDPWMSRKPGQARRFL